MNLHLSGGEGGIRHMLDHLGGPIESWWDDLGTPRLTPELIAKVVEGTEAALAGQSATAIAATRDGALLELLELKTAAGLPE
jgi:hypothetical protein